MLPRHTVESLHISCLRLEYRAFRLGFDKGLEDDRRAWPGNETLGRQAVIKTWQYYSTLRTYQSVFDYGYHRVEKSRGSGVLSLDKKTLKRVTRRSSFNRCNRSEVKIMG